MLFPILAGAAEKVDYDNENISTWVIHKVGADDKLQKLSQRYDVSISKLRENNNLNSDSLSKGRNLLIKETDVSSSYFLHEVENGDTPYLLSKHYEVSLDRLMEINNLDESSVLYIGDLIRIPVNLLVYTVESGDTPWKISNRFNLSLDNFLEINNLTESSVIYEGQKLLVPQDSIVKKENAENGGEDNGNYWVYTVEQGDTLWKISQRYGDVTLAQLLELNDLTEESILVVGQQVKIPGNPPEEQSDEQVEEVEDLEPTTTYETHTVSSGETPWSLSIEYGIPMNELLEVNDLTKNDTLSPGQELTIPVHHVPVHPTVSSDHGELLDWWTEAQYVWPINDEATIIDFDTGKSWQVQRSYGAAHADVEPLSSEDTSVMREVWGGNWSWKVRPVLVVTDGRQIAASASAMPHSIQKIEDNNFDGHSDIHFLNSRRHKDNTVSEAHQRAVHTAAGQPYE